MHGATVKINKDESAS